MLCRNFIHQRNSLDIGKFLFLIGVFFLPTALPIAGIFLLFSLFISFYKMKFSFLKEKVNLSIILLIGLILFSTTNNLIYQVPEEIKDLNYNHLWLNLFNWIPSLLCFIACQNYLKNIKDRLDFSKYFIAGTIPVIASCLFQLFFDNSGPFEIFNGLIIWFQKPIEETGGISGLFSNRNYAGIWLAVSLPFALYFFKKNLNSKINSVITLSINFLVIYLIIATNSRSAFLGMISTIILYLGFKSLLLMFLLIIFFMFINTILPIINSNTFSLLPNIFERFENIFFINSDRIVIFRSAINFILERPFLGWGVGTFYFIYTNKENMWNPPFLYFEPQHTHNLFLEMAFNFGIPIAIFVTSLSILLLIRAIPISFSKRQFSLDKAWFCATLVVFIMHINDVTFYDGKIGLLASILFSGLKCLTFSQEDANTLFYRNS